MKKIISLGLRIIPRETLQKIVLFLLPILSFWYRGKKYKDPISGKAHRKFLPYGRGEYSRKNALSQGKQKTFYILPKEEGEELLIFPPPQ